MSSSRDLIRSMFVIGSAQLINILVSVFRIKVLAVLLGPSGIGLLGIYNNLTEVVGVTAGLGIRSSGVRDVAHARYDKITQARVRRVLFGAHLVQGGLAMAAVWALRESISIWLFGDAIHVVEVGLVGVAVLFLLLSSAQTALLQGLRRISDLGRVTVISAFLSTMTGLLAVWAMGESGLIWFVLVQPVATVLIATYFTRRISRPDYFNLSALECWEIWKPMARLGVAFMLGGLVSTLTLMIIRSRISQEMGLDAAGYFAAAWAVAVTYIGILLGAMAADYFPRLTEVIRDQVKMNALMNDQLQIGLAVGGPILLLLTGFAPWVIELLYTADFSPAVNMLQWQNVGNVFKLASWALGFSIAASGRGKAFLFIQVNFSVLFLMALWPMLPGWGTLAVGPAFTVAYFLHFCVLCVFVSRIFGFRWEVLSIQLLIIHLGLAIITLALALYFPRAAAIMSLVFFISSGVFGLRAVLVKVGPEGRVASRLTSFFRVIGWPVRSAS